jgi:hypothetical protein
MHDVDATVLVQTITVAEETSELLDLFSAMENDMLAGTG